MLEVDRAGKMVWKYDKGEIRPFDAERLANGNTLIADHSTKRVIEVTRKREIIWEYKHGREVQDADRLPNGNTLITITNSPNLRRAHPNHGPCKVIEVTPKGKVVWELKGLVVPVDADRLPNGHTLVAERHEVSEYDAKGKKLRSRKVGYPGEVNRY